MNTEVQSHFIAPAENSPWRPLYWSVRRELWENRSLYVAPLLVAGLILIGFLVGAAHLPGKMRTAMALDPMQRQDLIEQPYNITALMIMGFAFAVAVFYCVDALHGERRDRSILFWKSLPVSDVTVVLSKASIPLLVLPLLAFAITLATQWTMLMIHSAVLLASGMSVAPLWSGVPWFSMSVMLLYHLVAIHGLWYAPFYGWLLLASAWARRAAFLWAVLPLIAIGVVEKIAFNTSHFAAWLQHRFMGSPEANGLTKAGSLMTHPLTLQTVGEFLVSPGLWIGLVISAALLAAATRLRHTQGPI